MNLDLLRIIDQWFGVPLCFMLTVLDHIFRLVYKPRPRPVKKVLVIKLAELGAIVLAYPCLKKLQQMYPQAQIYALTFKRNAKVFDLLDGLVAPQRVIAIDDGNWMTMLLSLAGTFKVLYKEKFEVVVDLEFLARISSLLCFFSFAPFKSGFYPYGFEGLYRGDFLTHKVAYNPLRHVSINYYLLAEALMEPSKDSPEVKTPIRLEEFTFPLYLTKSEHRKSLERFEFPLDKEIYLMNAGEGVLPLREWPLESFEKVARHILEDPGKILVLVGTDRGNTKAPDLCRELNDSRVINCTGKTDIFELMELFLISDTVIANDCGLVHLAMLTPIKKVVLFGPESPQVFGPQGPNTHVLYSRWPCSPCLSVLNHRRSSCRDNQCLKAIDVAQVVDILSKETSRQETA